ncbi:hypothetical protein OPQ81_008984 [Rhizoctonia solani]|nr:hypothetical protein OPQ81_008984 [Rhizoctonia solani]
MPKSASLSRAGSMRSTDVPVLSRDEHYYFQDGNVILLVGNILFRLHTSLLSRESEMFRNMFSKPVRVGSSMSLDGLSETSKKGKEGGCDENPIIMPQLQPQPFRNFLLPIYGRPSDKEFRSLFKGIAEVENVQAVTTFIKIIDIVDLAHRFIASDVETWALSQLKSYSRLIETINAYPISSKSHARLLNYAKRTEDEELTLWTRHWTRSYYAGAIETSSIASSAFGPVQQTREQLVREYKLATITQSIDTPIFARRFDAGRSNHSAGSPSSPYSPPAIHSSGLDLSGELKPPRAETHSQIMLGMSFIAILAIQFWWYLPGHAQERCAARRLNRVTMDSYDCIFVIV